MKHILITGGAGFIGSNLTSKLLNQGYIITCFDNFDTYYSRREKELNIIGFFENENFSFVEGDVRKWDNLEKIKNIDVIIHLAAKAGVRPSITDPLLYQDVNVAGTHNLLEYAKFKGIKQFIFTSSSSVYGINKSVPWNEKANVLPISPYASSKLADEMIGHVYSHLYGIQFLSLRLFTVYGPAQRPDLAIYKFFDLILKGKPIPVYGNGETSRDYTYVDDIVMGILASIEYNKSKFEIFNLGNNCDITLNQLITSIEDICGIKAIINRYPEQPGDVSRTFADIRKAEKLLGYRPSTNLIEGLRSFYEWFLTRQEINNKSLKLIIKG